MISAHSLGREVMEGGRLGGREVKKEGKEEREGR